tara:strand:+ start:100 stop:525 length:426 start_codon:yes stop_codon:yes gene_type:complete
MPSFNPLSPLNDMFGQPLKDSSIDDPKVRATLARLRGAYFAAPDAQKPGIEAELTILTEESQPVMTMGRAAIKALTDPLKGDEELSATVKVDNFTLAQKVRASVEKCELTDTELSNVKDRLAKAFPSAVIVGEFMMRVQKD